MRVISCCRSRRQRPDASRPLRASHLHPRRPGMTRPRAAPPLTIAALAVVHDDLFGRNLIMDRAAGASAGISLGHVISPIQDHPWVTTIPGRRAQIGQASDLRWFLVRFGRTMRKGSVVNRRIAWCVRTILIGRFAERGEPVFSIDKLSASTELSSVQHLIRLMAQPAVPDWPLCDFRSTERRQTNET